MKDSSSYRIIAEEVNDGGTIQLIENEKGDYRLLRVKADGTETCLSAPIYSDTRILAEAREYFPDHLPFGAVPVDAT